MNRAGPHAVAIAACLLALQAIARPEEEAKVLRVFVEGSGPAHDRRVTEPRTGDMTYTMPKYETKRQWLARRADLRRHTLVSCGLWPLPEKTPLNASIFGRIERDGYSVEKAYFESYPGFLVAGNLYRPLGRKGPFLGIACPHGHWQHGRLENTDVGSIPGRCINLARQGSVVFSYDMIGYNDSKQLPHDFKGEKEDLWGINLMGLQLWNSMRVVDFLCSLKDVDSRRIACTGASGGGTQTFMLMAVDDRIKVAAPVNMISAHFQGGCLCENAPLLRLDAYNVEIGAMMAPRPLILVCCTGDWTKNTPQVEYPDIRGIYELFGAADRVHYVQIDAGHNYNLGSREAVYAWFGRWLLGNESADSLKEQPFKPEADKDLLVFADRPLPANALDRDGIVRELIAARRKQLDALGPTSPTKLDEFRRVVGEAMRQTLSVRMPTRAEVAAELLGQVKGDGWTAERLLLGRRDKGDQVPALLFLSASAGKKAPATLVVHPQGKAALMSPDLKAPGALVSRLLATGQTVLTIDCFLTGEFNPDGGTTERKRDVNHFTTFNRTDVADRVQDILTAIGYLRSRRDVSAVNLIGEGEAGLWCLLARSQAPQVSAAAIDCMALDTSDDASYAGPRFIPGLRRAGGFPAAAALSATGRLLLHNVGRSFDTDWAENAYESSEARNKLRLERGRLGEDRILAWLAGG
jgi:dienelactone hydrolase